MRANVHPTKIKVDAEITLNAGLLEEHADTGNVYRTVTAPNVPMSEQLLAALRPRLDSQNLIPLTPEQEAHAAVLICLRWGSYFALLVDETLPAAREPFDHHASLISDEEMARINIEASSSLARLIALKRETPHVYSLYVRAALALPPPFNGLPKPLWDHVFVLRELASVSYSVLIRQALNKQYGPANAAELIKQAEQHPDRVLANSLINYCWRNNTSVEDLHAGTSGGYPLSIRRLTTREARLVLLRTGRLLASAFLALNEQMFGDDGRPWPTKALPFNANFLIAPRGWSLNEETRPIVLPRSEPKPTGVKGRISPKRQSR